MLMVTVRGASNAKVSSSSPSWRVVTVQGTEAVTALGPGCRTARTVLRPAAVKSSVAFKALLSGAQSVCRTKASKPVVRVPGR